MVEISHKYDLAGQRIRLPRATVLSSIDELQPFLRVAEPYPRCESGGGGDVVCPVPLAQLTFPPGSAGVKIHDEGRSALVTSLPVAPGAINFYDRMPRASVVQPQFIPSIPESSVWLLRTITRLLQSDQCEALGGRQLAVREVQINGIGLGVPTPARSDTLASQGISLVVTVDKGVKYERFSLPHDARGFVGEHEGISHVSYVSDSRLWNIAARPHNKNSDDQLPVGVLIELTPYAEAYVRMGLI